MTARHWKFHLGRLVLVTAFVLLIGLLVGYPRIALAVAAFIYLGWHLYNSWKLHRWLRTPRSEVPQSKGIWSDTFEEINALHQRTEQQYERYRAVIFELQTLTDAFPDATLVIDESDAITWFNDTARKQLGLRTPEDIGRPVTNFLRDPDFGNWLAIRDQITAPMEMASPLDETRRLSLSALDYQEGQRLLVVRDVTEVHDVERMRRDFVANVSHELRTPLTVLLGYLESMRDQCADDLEPAVERMQAQASQMQALLDDLLELSRLQGQQLSGEESEVDILAMLAQLREQAEEFDRDRHEIIWEIEPDLNVSGVAADLESAFRNLIVNAITYTPAGGTIRVRWEDSVNGPAFSVKDDGPGIPRRDLPRLTERFYRVGADRSRERGGTGLGLSIVKHVINAHQARLTIDSELGEGSEFICTFPISRRCWRSATDHGAVGASH